MVEVSFEDLRVRFKKIYANLPEKVRDEDIIVVIEKEPYTWNAVLLEVNNNTHLGIQMLKRLNELKII